MTRKDILDRLKTEVEKRYNEFAGSKFNGVDVINFELMDDGSLRVYVRVLFLGAWSILHGRITDTRDYEIDLTEEEREFLKEAVAQAPDRIAPQTKVSRYVIDLVSQLRHIVSDGRDDPRWLTRDDPRWLTKALLSNPNLTGLITHGNVDSIVAYVERLLGDLECDHRSGAAVSWVTALLSNPSLSSMIDSQIYSDQK